MREKAQSVTIPMSDFVKEHTNLAKVLTTGTPAQRAKEAKEQTQELKAQTGKGGIPKDTPQGHLRNIAGILEGLAGTLLAFLDPLFG